MECDVESKNICPICLRTNRKLKVIPIALSQYHEELTDYTLPCKNYKYCGDCDCLLRKTYNFQKKCSNAAKVLNNWINATTTDKTNANLLHQKLPPISLGLWKSENTKVFDYIGTDSKKPILTKEECISDLKRATNTFEELNIPEMLDRNVLKYEDTESKIIGNIKLFNKIDLNNVINGVSSTSCKNFSKVEEVFCNKSDIHKDHNLDVICLNDSDNKNDNIIVIDDDDEYPDDASLNSNDDCDEYINPPPVKRKLKRQTLDELANISLSDEDLDDDYNNRSDKDEKLISTERNIISRLEIIDKSLDSLCNNWEVTSLLTEVKDKQFNHQTKDKAREKIHNFLTERKTLKPRRLNHMKKLGALFKIQHLNNDLDLIHEECSKTVENYQVSPKERLKAMLKKWGELKTEDGSVFNKDVIINCLDKVPERYVKHLLRLMYGKKRLSSAAAKVLTFIQENPNQHLSKYESVFDMEFLCTEEDKLEEFQRRKTYECYVKAEFKCEICFQVFKTKKYLEFHVKQNHVETQGNVSCRICHMSPKHGLAHHMTTHNAVFKCKLCPLVTYYRGSMIKHYEQHNGTIYKCEKCTNTFRSTAGYMFHQSRIHPRGNHACLICGNTYVSKSGLKLHMTLKHQGESSVAASGSGFSCEECNLTFSSDIACFRHLQITHEKRQMKRTRLAMKYKRVPSKNTKKSKNTMVCPECKAVGHAYGWMVNHFKLQHPSLDLNKIYAMKHKYLCDICGKGFSNITMLTDHIRFHTGVGFPCPTCNKQFRNRTTLHLHQLRHAPPRYSCDRCGKKFHTGSNLSNHMRIHVGDRRYKCQICGKGFLYSCSLTAHIRGVHNHERRIKKQGVTRKRRVIDRRTSDAVADTSIGVTETSNRVTDTSSRVTDTSNDVSYTKAFTIFDVGAEEIVN